MRSASRAAAAFELNQLLMLAIAAVSPAFKFCKDGIQHSTRSIHDVRSEPMCADLIRSEASHLKIDRYQKDVGNAIKTPHARPRRL
jgi:hypothetical protein